jgi:hypothetical protein
MVYYNPIMDAEKKQGIILIVIGICIPLIALPFVSGYAKDRGFIDNLYGIGIQLRKGSPEPQPGTQSLPATGNKGPKKIDWNTVMPEKIPFRLFLVFTVILLYLGIIRIDRARRRRKAGNNEQIPAG